MFFSSHDVQSNGAFLITNQDVHLYNLEHVLFDTEHTKHIFIIETMLCTL
jgi:hypothetical protein